MRGLRSGFTTGTCAAGAAKSAVELLLGLRPRAKTVELSLPDGQRVKLKIKSRRKEDGIAYASIIKDAGDDPDVTDKAEIAAIVKPIKRKGITIRGGQGVGTVTRPGLPVKTGRAAINPVPRQMIKQAVTEVLDEIGMSPSHEVTIVVPEGEQLLKRTLNARLGIVGGISIIGTTGIVKPLSTAAWTATISSSMSVAQASGLDEIVLCSGRTSERVHMQFSGLPEASYVMMGDYVKWSLQEVRNYRFKKVHLAAQWAKMLKIAMGTPDTHVRAGAFSMKKAVPFLKELGLELLRDDFNTAREIFECMRNNADLLMVLKKAEEYACSVSAMEVKAWLITYDDEVLG
jgi:cobalt-precorrin-5B (C1)-methyltransferase